MTTLKNPSRRKFLKSSAAVGGLVIGVQIPQALAKVAVKSSMPNAWIRIGSDNTVTVLVARSEMGQGVVMALPTLVAEELEVDLKKIKVDFAPPGEVYINGMLGGQITGGSTSVRDGWDKLRIAGAQARVMLTEAAAQQWKVDASKCGFRSTCPNSRRVVCPSRSTRIISRSVAPASPTRNSRKSPSSVLGESRVQTRPSLSPPSLTLNSARMSPSPASSIAGVPTSVSAAGRIVTCARSTSWNQTVVPSETMTWAGWR